MLLSEYCYIEFGYFFEKDFHSFSQDFVVHFEKLFEFNFYCVAILVFCNEDKRNHVGNLDRVKIPKFKAILK